MNAILSAQPVEWFPADDFPGYEFSRTATRVYLRCAKCERMVNQWPIYETHPLLFVHICEADGTAPKGG